MNSKIKNALITSALCGMATAIFCQRRIIKQQDDIIENKEKAIEILQNGLEYSIEQWKNLIPRSLNDLSEEEIAKA